MTSAPHLSTAPSQNTSKTGVLELGSTDPDCCDLVILGMSGRCGTSRVPVTVEGLFVFSLAGFFILLTLPPMFQLVLSPCTDVEFQAHLTYIFLQLLLSLFRSLWNKIDSFSATYCSCGLPSQSPALDLIIAAVSWINPRTRNTPMRTPSLNKTYPGFRLRERGREEKKPFGKEIQSRKRETVKRITKRHAKR